ncbi:MAG: hypothetical protein WB424_18800 [Terracidiphilus sp.]
MKRIFGFVLACIFLSIPAFAATYSQTVTFTSSVQVGAAQLPAGDYKVTWAGTGDNVQVTLSKKGVQPVTVTAKVVEQKHDHTGVTTNSTGDKNILQVILLSKFSLVL